MRFPQGYTQRLAGVFIGERRGVHADGLGLGKAPTVPDCCCKFRVRKDADDACVAPMVGADNLEREMLKTRVIVGAESAYFCAQSDARSMDVLLPAGKGVIAGLQERIDEMQADIERRAARVAFLREAMAAYLAG